MIPALRQRYNAAFTDARSAEFQHALATGHRYGPDFRVAESPLFLDEAATRALAAAAADILAQLATPEFRAHAATLGALTCLDVATAEWVHRDGATTFGRVLDETFALLKPTGLAV